MKKLFHILVPLGLLLMVSVVNMPAQTVIETWDFETEVGNWASGNGDASIELSTDKAHGGSQALKMVGTSTSTEINLQNDTYKPAEGDILSFWIWMSTADLADVDGVQIFWQTGSSWENWHNAWTNGTDVTADAWYQVQVALSPVESPLQRIGLQITGKSGTDASTPTLYVDDITVSQIPPGELITVDGERDAFFDGLTGPDDGYLQLQAFHGNDNGFASGNADLSAKMWVAWDDSCFYVYEEVVDDVISMTSGNTYQNDGMELKFDPVPDDSSSVSNSIVGLQMTVLDTTGGVTGVANFPGTAFRKLTDDGYVLEAAIPWEDIAFSSTTDPEEVNVAVDGVFGLCMQNHDNDNPNGARDGSVQWSAVMLDAAWNHTEYLATAKFLAGNKLQLIPTNEFSGATNDLPYDGTVSTTLVIDGNRDPWYDLLTGPDDGFLILKAYTGNDNGMPHSDADLSAKIWTAWNDECFYLYEEVMDDTISMTSGNTYQNDGMELKFDPVPDDSSGVSNSIVALQMTVKDTTGGVTGVANFPGTSFRKETSDGYVLEAAIPWEDIVYEPSTASATNDTEKVNVAVDEVFGLVMQNHDNDNPNGARDGSVQWSAVMLDAAWNHTEYLATAKFLADGKLQLIPTNEFSGATNDIPYDGTPFYMRIDCVKDPFYYSLTRPSNGYLQLRYYAYSDNGKPDDDDDLSAKIWTAWDDSCYYLYEEVKDDMISMSSSNTYQNDGMEIKIDPIPDDSTQTTVVAVQMTVQDSTGGVTGWTNFPGEFARKTVSGGYVLEAAMPWSELDLDDEAVDVGVGNIFGAVLQNHDNDNDEGNRDGTVMWAAVLLDAAWNNAKYLGTVEFLADHKLKYVAKNEMTGVVNGTPYNGSDTGSIDNIETVAYKYDLKQNYPNPFNPVTTISYGIEKATDVRLTVYDILGREVATLVNEIRQPGFYHVQFDASRFASGLYLYRIEAGSFVKTQKMMLLK